MAGGGPDDGQTDRIRRLYDRRAAGRDGGDGRHVREVRRWLAERVEGLTLEVGVGRGGLLPYFPRSLPLTGIELSPACLAVARARAAALGRQADLRLGDAAALPFVDDHFDTVVFAFVLCTVPDDRRAVAEAVRVLRPGGRLLLVEHVRSPNPLVRLVERALDPFTVRWQADHLLREPLELVLGEGLEVETLERHWLGIEERLAARKPGESELALAV